MKLKSKKTFFYHGNVHDISVENTHTYNIESLAVHNSAAGCLISYLIGITGIDPIPHKLLFSRFYNSSRAGSLPDIDLDVESAKRGEIIEYIKSKYGAEKVSQMVTFGCLMGRSALKEVLRIEDVVSFAEMNDITAYIPNEAEIADDLESSGETSIIRWSLINRPNKFAQWCQIEEDGSLTGDLAEYFEKAIKLEGTPKSQGKHAAGVIISSQPLAKICPMVRDKDGNPVAGFEMGSLESLGHVKFDILGIDFLDKIAEIARDGNLNINDFEDKQTWESLCNGDTKGVFQLERQSRWTKALKPQNIDHLSALTAIIRPGVVEAIEDGKPMTKHYIDRKNLVEEMPSIHSDLDAILKDTYGVLVYQETAMLLAREIAGFSLNEADLLRKAIGKKKVDLMTKVKNEFMTKAKELGKYSEEIYTKIFDWIEKSQRYSFNASVTENCFVETIVGELKSILDINIGEQILSPSGPTTVLNKFDHGEQEVYEIILESGKQIECTLEHKFLCEDKQVRKLYDIIINNHKIITQCD